MLYIAGISISFFLGVLLAGKKNKTLADKILAAWLFVIGFHLLFFWLFITKKVYEYPALLGVGLPFPLLHGPFLFLYASALTGRLQRFGIRAFLHFLPPLISYLYLFPFFLRPAEEKIYVFEHKGEGYETYIALNVAAILVSGILYVALTAWLHFRHRKKILDEFSYTEKINLDWIRYLIVGIAVIWVFVFLNRDDYVFGTAVVFVIFIGYFGNKQVGIFTSGSPQPAGTGALNVPEQEAENDPITDERAGSEDLSEGETDVSELSVIEGEFGKKEKSRKKYEKSGLSEEGAVELYQKLSRAMGNEKLFTNGDLTLTDLAKKLGTHPNYLSQVINVKEGKNFFDYINTLRTEEFKRLVTDPHNQKFTLLSLAYECGFNSKSSFNKYFKKVTGQQPSEYLKQVQAVRAA